MNSASNVAYLLLITHNHNHIETHFIFSIFVTMHRPSSIYVVCTTGKNAVISPDFLVWEFCGKAQFPLNFHTRWNYGIFRSVCDLFSIFTLIFIIISHIISLKQTHLFLARFLECKMNDFESQKFGFRVLLSFCLIFCQFQPGVSLKSVAYKKAAICSRHRMMTTTYRLRKIFSWVINSFMTEIPII